MRCAYDVQLFAEVFFPHYCVHPFNDFHKDTFKSYEYGKRKVRDAKCAPRGYAKSTIDALIKPIHDICYCLEKFIVIGSNTIDQSQQKLKDIKNELLTNDVLIYHFGSLLKKRIVASTDFIVDNAGFKIRLLAIGSKTEVRGIRFGEARPTKIILDDIEHSTEVENEQIREKYEDWFKDVISKIGDENTSIIVVGTILHRKSLLKRLLCNPRYVRREYKAVISWPDNKKLWKQWEEIYKDIQNEYRQDHALEFFKKNEKEMLKGVKVLWPEKEPYYDLAIEIITDGMRSFMKEKQNDPMSSEDKIFHPDDFHYFKQEDEGLIIKKTGKLIRWEEMSGIFASIDPSAGEVKPSTNKKSDFTCIPVGYKDRKGRLFVIEAFLKRVKPTTYIKEIFEIHDCYDLDKLAVETNLFRKLLIQNIVDERKRRSKKQGKEIKLPIYEVLNLENKTKRIYTLEPKISHGWILFNESLSEEFFGQFFDFPQASHDDAPDAIEMLWNLANNRYKASEISKSVHDR